MGGGGGSGSGGEGGRRRGELCQTSLSGPIHSPFLVVEKYLPSAMVLQQVGRSRVGGAGRRQGGGGREPSWVRRPPGNSLGSLPTTPAAWKGLSTRCTGQDRSTSKD